MSSYLKNNSYDEFLKCANSYRGTFYLWGGDDPSGFDCSGFVVECLKSAGFMLDGEDASANDLWHRYADKIVVNPVAGALIFRFDGNGKAIHIGICLDEDFYIAAEGGGGHIMSTIDAIKHDAFIKIRPITKIKNPRFIDLWKDCPWRIDCE